MKIAIAALLVVTTAIFGREIIGRGCGDATMPIRIAVLDADSKAPVTDAQVVFFSARDVAWKERIKLEKNYRKATDKGPVGNTAISDKQGEASVQCCFHYSQAIYDSGEKIDEYYPDGTFEVEHPEFESLSVEARTLYPSSPYNGTLPKIVILVKRKTVKLSP